MYWKSQTSVSRVLVVQPKWAVVVKREKERKQKDALSG